MDKWLKSLVIKRANVNIHFRVICTIYLVVLGHRRCRYRCRRYRLLIYIQAFSVCFSHIRSSHFACYFLRECNCRVLFTVHWRIEQQMIALFFLPVAFSSGFRMALVYGGKQWEMSSKPYHSLCKQENFTRASAMKKWWRNVKSCKVTKLITGLDAVLFFTPILPLAP